MHSSLNAKKGTSHWVTCTILGLLLVVVGNAGAAAPPAKAGPATQPVKRTRAQVEALIAEAGRTPPAWWDSVALNYPPTLDLTWRKIEGWDNQRNVGQYIWDIVDPNPGRWKEGVKLVHHVLSVNRDNPEAIREAMQSLSHMYAHLLEDYPRAAFWALKHGRDPILLADCYWKMGCKEMAAGILSRINGDPTRNCSIIKLWSDMGELDRALRIAEQEAQRGRPVVAYLAAADACRKAGRYKQALTFYEKAVASDNNPRAVDAKMNSERARAGIEAIKVFDSLDLSRIADGQTDTTSSFYNGRDQLLRQELDLGSDNAIDSTTIFAYDANGSTIEEKTLDGQGATISDKRYAWDLRNHLVGLDANGNGDTIDPGDATFTYDSDGLRVGSSVVGGDTTTDLVDKNNPTGYSQVLEERVNGTLNCSYLLGLDVIGQFDASVGVRFFVYDGHGSTRALITQAEDSKGNRNDQTYDYDAFGNMTNPYQWSIVGEPQVQTVTPTGAASAGTHLLYSGEVFDAVLGQYQNRARYYDPTLGRFSNFDGFEGESSDPLSLHKYVYAIANPIRNIDPSGHFFTVLETLFTHATGSLNESPHAAQAGQVLRMAKTLNDSLRFLNQARRVWDTISWIRDAMSFGEFSAAEQMAISAGLAAFRTLKPHVNVGPLSIPIPRSVVTKLRKISGPFFDTPPGQAMIGVAFAALVATVLDWKTTSIEANYHGVDAIMKAANGLYLVIEAKGGSGKLEGNQMTDPWIESKVQKAIRQNPGADADALRRLRDRGPLIAIVVSTDLSGSNPAMRIQLQTYRGINEWQI